MDQNPYQAPQSELQQSSGAGEAPALWNPNAAASWCIIFSITFGAVLHMKNWEALGEKDKAASAKIWFFSSLVLWIVLILSNIVAPGQGASGPLRLIFFVLLISWYFASAKSQVAFVESRYGTNYPHKGWLKPILVAILALICLTFVSFIVALIAHPAAVSD